METLEFKTHTQQQFYTHKTNPRTTPPSYLPLFSPFITQILHPTPYHRTPIQCVLYNIPPCFITKYQYTPKHMHSTRTYSTPHSCLLPSFRIPLHSSILHHLHIPDIQSLITTLTRHHIHTYDPYINSSLSSPQTETL